MLRFWGIKVNWLNLAFIYLSSDSLLPHVYCTSSANVFRLLAFVRHSMPTQERPWCRAKAEISIVQITAL